MSLDLRDKKILYELDKNARIPISILSKKLKINQNTAQYRLKRLEDEGYIKGYYAIIDNSKLGYFGFRVYFKFSNTTKKLEDEMFGYLSTIGAIHIISKAEGVYDAMIICWVKSIYEFEELWNKFKEKYKFHIGRMQIAIFTKVYHFQRDYLISNKTLRPVSSEHLIVGSSEVISHDAIDIKILKVISGNARIPILELSKKINIPVKTVMYRLKNLEKNKIIVGYKPNIVLDKIDYHYYKVNFVLSDMSKIKQLLEFSKSCPYITYVDNTISSNDFEVDIEVPDRTSLDKIYFDIKEKFSNIVDYEEFKFKEILKLVYF